MSDTSKIELQSRGVVHHEYKRGPSDWCLDMAKLMISNPETRHALLPKWAAISDWLLPRINFPASLEKSLQFHDRSLPITLSNPIILAAGGNKYAENLTSFGALGFGAVTVGSATREPREGNPYRPRVRMLPDDRAMNNSMGLNNAGIEAIAREVDKCLGICHKRKLALGISVAETPGLKDPSEKLNDILTTFRRAYGAADYIELNVSCPNTGSSRLDNHDGFFSTLMNQIMETRKALAPRKAVFVKLSPDLGQKSLESILDIMDNTGVTGLVLFNTFPSDKAKFLKMKTPKDQILPVSASGGKGGLSGRILYQNTLPAVQFIRRELPKMTIFAAGGVDHGAKVLDLLEAGADAVQCYTVLAYRMNAVRKMLKELLTAMEKKSIMTLEDLRGDPL